MAVFVNVARHLAADGVFVLEGFVPNVSSFRDGQNVQLNRMVGSEIDLVIAPNDPVRQHRSRARCSPPESHPRPSSGSAICLAVRT